jgi:hypothetical protein
MNEIDKNEWSSHTLNCMNLYDAGTPAGILFMIQKLININPGSHDHHWP